MKKPVRFYIAITLTRLSIALLRLFGFAATHVPGTVALKVCPTFLQHIDKPKQLIAITGTNGKTTVSNMIADFYKAKNIAFANNSAGSNIQEGIIVSMLSATTFFGKRKIDHVILEVDERVSYKIYPYLKPTILIITNLFRDSYKRNAHPEYIYNLLEQSIPDETTLIVNADDVISSTLKANNKKLSFSIAQLSHEQSNNDCLIHDMKHCPVCHYPLQYHFTRYHHIGHASCSVCGFKNIPSDVKIIQANPKENKAFGEINHQRFEINYNPNSIMELYNRLSVITALYALDFPLNDIINTIKNIKTVETRYQHIVSNDKEIILMLAKDQNPIAVSRVFDSVSLTNDKRVGIILINENHENHKASENMAWYYDTDFERLNKPHIKQIIEGGYRSFDFVVRAKLAGISDDVIDYADNEINAANKIDFSKVDIVYVLYGTKNIKEANLVKERLRQKAKEEHTHGN